MTLRAAQAALLLPSAMLWPVLADASPLVLANASPLAPRDVPTCKLPAVQSVLLSSGFGFENGCVPSVGTVSAFAIFIDFPDAVAFEAPQELYDFFFPGAEWWFQQASYGQLNFNFAADTTTIYRMARSSDSYNLSNSNFTAEDHQAYIQDAINAYTFSGQFMPSADLLYIVPTSRARSIISATYMNRMLAINGSQISLRTVTLGHDAYDAWGYLKVSYGAGLAMCLPELFPVAGGPTGLYVGGWDLMGSLNAQSPDLFAWDKFRLGWIKDQSIDCVTTSGGSSTHVLTPLYRAEPGTKAVIIACDNTSALVVEARLAGGSIDNVNCSPGLLLYTVNTTIPTGHGPIRVIDANPNTNGCDFEPLNDATLNINGTKSLNVPDFNVTVAIISQSNLNITITLDYDS